MIQNTLKDDFRKKSHPFYLGAYILFAIYMLVQGFFSEGFSFFDPVWNAPMTNYEFIITFLASMLCALSLLVLAHKKFKIKPNYVLIFIGLLLIAIDAAALWTVPEHMEIFKHGSDHSYTLTNAIRFRDLAFWISSVIGLYLILGVIPKMFYSQKQMDIVANIFIIGIIGVVIADTIINCQYYSYIFNIVDSANGSSPGSLCGNKNTFGRIMALAFYCSIYMHSKYKTASKARGFYTLCLWYFFVMMILSNCRTQQFVITCTLGIYGIWCFFNSYKKRKTITWIKFFAYFLIIGTISTLIAIPSIEQTEILRNLILKNFEHLFGNTASGSFVGRDVIWQNSKDLILSSPRNMLLGFGDRHWEICLCYLTEHSGNYFPQGCSHNNFLFSWGRLGILGLLLNCSMYLYALYLSFRGMKRGNNFAFGNFLMICGIFVTGFVEDVALLDLRTIPFLTNVMLFVPLLIEEAKLKNPYRNDRKVKRIAVNKLSKVKLTDNKLLELSSFCSMLILIVIVGFGPIYNDLLGYEHFDKVYALVAISLSALYLPLSIALSLYYKEQDRFKLHIFYLALGLLTPSLVTIFAWKFDNITIPVIAALMYLTLIPLFRKDRYEYRVDIFYDTFLFILVGLECVAINHLSSGLGQITDNTRYGAYALAVLNAMIFIFMSFLSPFAQIGNFIGLDLAHRYENVYFKILFRETARGELITMNTSR